MIKKIFGLTSTIMMLCFLGGTIVAQSTPTTEPVEVSLFPDEDCERICWQGLVTGESSAEDVEEVLINLESELLFWQTNSFNPVIDDQTGYLIQGSYRFVWEGDRNFTMSNNRNFITIQDSIVGSIFLVSNEPIPISDVLELLGTPDDIRFVSGYQIYHLTFIYIDELIEVRYTIPETCSIQTIDEDSETEIIYRNYVDASELVETDYGLQPSLLAYEFIPGTERQVPLDTLNTWLNLEDIHCFYLWESLPETIELPAFPAPEATEQPNEEKR